MRDGRGGGAGGGDDAAVGLSAARRAGAESFAAAWDVALDEGQVRAQSTAIERALDGVVEPVFYRGMQVGERRRYDNRLLLTALRRWSPDRRASWQDLADFLGSPPSDA